MVFLGVEYNKDYQESTKYINKFRDNLKKGSVSNIIFKDDSFIEFVGEKNLVVYLNPIMPRQIYIYIVLILSGVAIMLNVKFLYYVVGIMVLLFLSFRYIIFLLLKAGLRKQGYRYELKLL